MTEILKSVSVFKVQINLCLFCNEMCVFWALITRVMMNVSLMLMRHYWVSLWIWAFLQSIIEDHLMLSEDLLFFSIFEWNMSINTT